MDFHPDLGPLSHSQLEADAPELAALLGVRNLLEAQLDVLESERFRGRRQIPGQVGEALSCQLERHPVHVLDLGRREAADDSDGRDLAIDGRPLA